MKINRNNYELWMIDYFDGKLNADEIAVLLSFVDLHPDIKEEFDLFESVPLEADDIGFEKKQSLKKAPLVSSGAVNETNYEKFFIAYYEGDLKTDQEQEVSDFVALNPLLKNEFILHGQLIFDGNQEVIYEDKEDLKKKKRIGVYWWTAAAAASLLVLFGLFNLINLNQSSNIERFASIYSLENREPYILLSQEQDVSIIQTDITSETRTFVFINGEEAADKKAIIEPTFEDRYTLAKLEKRNIDVIQTDFFDITLIEQSENNSFSDIYASANLPESSKKKGSLLGRIVKNYAKKANSKMPKTENEKKNNDPGFLKVLDQSIVVFNTITGSDAEMVKTYDDDGQLTKYHIEGETISWGKDYASQKEAE